MISNMSVKIIKRFQPSKLVAYTLNRLYSVEKQELLNSEVCTKWVEPVGYDTGIFIYNTPIKKKVKLKTIRKSVVSWYSCGPTVYDSPHIGHACCYLYQDIIRRIMVNFFHLNVVYVMGITDIDDKIIKRSNILKMPFTHISRQYEKEFIDSLNYLNILPPNLYGRVSEHIPEVLIFINKLIDSGFAYPANGSVYFGVKEYQLYGYLYPIPQGDTEPDVDKRSPNDFALWKRSKDGEPSWESPWGPGRPGWHIECSAIASKLLGNQIDLHSGGADLIFPHHENEEAQSCCYHGVNQWINYWLHTGHLHLKGDVKMSKSLNNTVSIQEFLKNYSGNDLRMLCLITRYKNGIEYSESAISTAVSLNNKFKHFLTDCDSYCKDIGEWNCVDEPFLFNTLNETEEKVKGALGNDFNTAEAVSYLSHLVSVTNSMIRKSDKVNGVSRSPVVIAAVSSYILNYLQLFGLKFQTKELCERNLDINSILDCALQFRSNIRKTALTYSNSEMKPVKNDLLRQCDEFRNNLKIQNIEIKDQGKTSAWAFVKQ